MRSVCARSFSMSILPMSQLRMISAAASAGMMPSRPCTVASAFSISTYFAVRFSSDQTRRVASVLKMFPKMVESTTDTGMAADSLPDDRGGIHRKPAFVVPGPEMERLSIRARLAADVEGMGVERRPDCTKLVAGDFGPRRLMAQEVEQQRREERPMDDQARILLDLRDIAPVVVDAVLVEGQRRVAEQEHVIGNPLLLPRRGLRRWPGRRRDIVRL